MTARVLIACEFSGTERREHMSDDERRRFDEGRHDWRDEDWEDHCGRIGCAVCEARPTRL